jgi:hypothetical protein
MHKDIGFITANHWSHLLVNVQLTIPGFGLGTSWFKYSTNVVSNICLLSFSDKLLVRRKIGKAKARMQRISSDLFIPNKFLDPSITYPTNKARGTETKIACLFRSDCVQVIRIPPLFFVVAWNNDAQLLHLRFLFQV